MANLLRIIASATAFSGAVWASVFTTTYLAHFVWLVGYEAAQELALFDVIYAGTMRFDLPFITIPAQYVPYPPNISAPWSEIAIFCAAVIGLKLLVDLLRPVHSAVKNVSVPGASIKPLEAPIIVAEVSAMAESFGISMPRLFVTNGANINAHAFKKPFGASAIVLSGGLMQAFLTGALSDEEKHLRFQAFKFILAHELSHLAHGEGVALWISGSLLWASMQIDRARDKLHRMVYWLATRLPVPYWLVLLFLTPISLIILSLKLFERIAATLFRLMDAMISRRIEYRCDRQAGEEVGGQHGVNALTLIGSHQHLITKSIFDSHPSLKKRISKLSSS